MVWEEKKTLDGLHYYSNSKSGELTWQKPEELMTEEEKEDSSHSWVWVPHKTDKWQPAQVLKTDDDGTVHVRTEGGTMMKIPKSGVVMNHDTGNRREVVPLWELKKSNLRFLEDDLVMLDPVNEAFILYNLRQRYKEDKIYTWVGASNSVLVSVNPYKNIELFYGDAKMDVHRNKPPNMSLEPHVFDVANDAYNSMAFGGVNQSILISGESGAGKTEATKHCLSFLAYVNVPEKKDDEVELQVDAEEEVEDKVLRANPLLEAFGNAKTIRNINSSRFGKWMEVYFDKKSTNMVGSKIFNYLLERNRVVTQQNQERNFHIFYALFHGEARSKFNLTNPDDYNYLNQSGCINVAEFNDEHNLNDVRRAMEVLEFSAEEQDAVFQLTTAVLKLGNITFNGKTMKGQVAGSEIQDANALSGAAELLMIKPEVLEKVLTFRTISAGAKFDKPIIPLSPAAARTGRDSLAMAIYGKLFQWLVDRVNSSLGNQDRTKNRFLGILDIFGFEIFENNSFEQLCINYANERLQQLFNQTTFKEEEALYLEEGVPYEKVAFIDNKQVLDMIEDRRHGILTLLDDEIITPGGNENNFVNKVLEKNKNNDLFTTDNKRRFKIELSFEIQHYAGQVKYDATNFMAKNLDTVFLDMYDAVESSELPLLRELFEESDTKIRTISKQFKGQLKELMNTLDETESRFIRCIKPNANMAPDDFVPRMCVEQLRYSGVFEAVEIRKKGYPFRYPHLQFACRYSCINQGYKYKNNIKSDPKAYCQEILEVAKADFSKVQMGKSMVLYRANEHKDLLLHRSLALEKLIPKMQSVARGRLQRKFTAELHLGEMVLREALKNGVDDYNMVEAAIKEANERCEQVFVNYGLLNEFQQRPLSLPVAEQLFKDLGQLKELEETMEKYAAVEDPNPLYEQLKEIRAEVDRTMDDFCSKESQASVNVYGRKSYVAPRLSENQRQLVEVMEERIRQCVLGILDKDTAAALRDYHRGRLEDCLNRAKELNHDTEDLRKAKELLEKIEQLDIDADWALALVSKRRLAEVVENARTLRQDNSLLRRAKAMHDLPEEDFVQLEYETAARVQDEERRVHRELRLMEFKYESIPKLDIANANGARPNEEWSKKPALQQTMFTWQKKKIKKSLVKDKAEAMTKEDMASLSPEEKREVRRRRKDFRRNALRFNKQIRMFMGDYKVKVEKSNVAAIELVNAGVQAYQANDNALLQELYSQVIKQITGNPSTDKDQESASKGIELLGMFAEHFPPSTEDYNVNRNELTFDDYVIMFTRTDESIGERREPLLTAMHNTKYDTTLIKGIDVIEQGGDIRAGASVERRFSIDATNDSDPTKEAEELYKQLLEQTEVVEKVYQPEEAKSEVESEVDEFEKNKAFEAFANMDNYESKPKEEETTELIKLVEDAQFLDETAELTKPFEDAQFAEEVKSVQSQEEEQPKFEVEQELLETTQVVPEDEFEHQLRLDLEEEDVAKTEAVKVQEVQEEEEVVREEDGKLNEDTTEEDDDIFAVFDAKSVDSDEDSLGKSIKDEYDQETSLLPLSPGQNPLQINQSAEISAEIAMKQEQEQDDDEESLNDSFTFEKDVLNEDTESLVGSETDDTKVKEQVVQLETDDDNQSLHEDLEKDVSIMVEEEKTQETKSESLDGLENESVVEEKNNEAVDFSIFENQPINSKVEEQKFELQRQETETESLDGLETDRAKENVLMQLDDYEEKNEEEKEEDDKSTDGKDVTKQDG